MQMKINHLRWFGVFSILAIVIISYVDRINVSVLITNQHFLNYLGIAGDRVAQGELMTLFLIGYGIAAFFLSPIYEIFLGVRKGLLISIFIWGFFTIISPFAGTVTLFLLFRFILGASEGPLFSLKTMYVKDEFQVNERGKPNAITSMGVSIGLAIGFPIITFLIYQFDWKMSFYILGLLNLIIGVPLIYFFIRTTKANNTNQNHHASKLTFQGLGKTMKSAFQTPGLIWILIIEIATLSFLWGNSSWLPSYLLETRHFSIKEMGWISSLPFIVSIGSGFLGGYIIDKIQKKNIVFLFLVGGLMTALFVTIAIMAKSPLVSAFCLILENAFWGIQGPAIPTLVQNLSDPRSVGSTYGIVNGIGNLVSAFMPAIMGVFIGGSGNVSFTAGFSLLIGTQLVTAICGILFYFTKVNKQMNHSTY